MFLYTMSNKFFKNISRMLFYNKKILIHLSSNFKTNLTYLEIPLNAHRHIQL